MVIPYPTQLKHSSLIELYNHDVVSDTHTQLKLAMNGKSAARFCDFFVKHTPVLPNISMTRHVLQREPFCADHAHLVILVDIQCAVDGSAANLAAKSGRFGSFTSI